ncbi:MAG: peptidoglycan DD-metalloendopeptidase family protein [Negativicutes bacterium]|nr:peptidoglycan DD-metalloendopeptidase family protein [Negativicutes bacterium]
MKIAEGRIRQRGLLIALAFIAGILLWGLVISKMENRAIPLNPAPLIEHPSQRALKEDVPGETVRKRTTRKHTVAEGETLSGIAARYNIDIDTLYGANHHLDERIYPGDEIIILPEKGVLHKVAAGDTLESVSLVYGVTAEAIAAANGKADDFLAVGEMLFIPGGKPHRPAGMPSRSGAARFYWPARGEMSSGFGYRWGKLHAGIDLAAETGEPVSAARSGVVAYAGWWGGYGYTVILDHGQQYLSLYGHLDDYTVSPGEYVRAGERIGHVGNTGYSTGPHLHFEIHFQGVPVNPLNLLP